MPKPKRPNQTTRKPASEKSEQTFLDHLHELRNRFFFVAITMIVAGSLGYTWHKEIVQVLLAPLHGEKLVYLTPGGGFDFIFKISLYFGFLVTIPVLIYHFYRYLLPLMKRTSRKFVIFLVSCSIFLATSGVLFGYFVAVPAALKFLTGFGGEFIDANLTAESYLNFVTLYLLGFAFMFQLPLVMLCINAISGPHKPSKLLKFEPYVVLGAFVAAAIITPTPDVFNQSITAAPIIGIYQFGILFIAIHNRGYNKTYYKRLEQKKVTPIIHLPELPDFGYIETHEEPAKPSPKPLVAPVQVVPKQVVEAKPAVQQAPRRTMDGFVSRSAPGSRSLSRPAIQPVARPQPRLSRQVVAVRPLSPPRAMSRRVSIDGISG